MPESSDILVIDGDPSTRHLIRLVLLDAYPDANVVEVEAAVPFAEVWSSRAWRAAVFDPSTSSWSEGPRLVTALKRRDPGIGVFILSDGLEGDAVADLFRAGADDVLAKSPDQLVELPQRLEPVLFPTSARPESDLGEPTVEAYLGETELLRAEPSDHGLLRAQRPGRGLHLAARPAPSSPAAPPSVWPDDAPSVVALSPDATAAPADDPTSPTRGDSAGPTDPWTPVERGGPDPSAMVHDLKEPLRTIHMLLERCDRRHRESLPSEARSLIQWAQRSAQQLESDLDELQAEVSGASSGGAVEADASEALTNALRNLEALGRETDARVTTAVLPRVRVPPSAVRRVLENLIANAMRHRGERPPEIHVGARELDVEAVFSIKDNGPGITEALRHRVFEPGVRGEQGGAGLGLYSARRLVERWGGQVWFDTGRDEGTTFYFTLPLASPRSAAHLSPVHGFKN